MTFSQLPAPLSAWLAALADALDPRSAPRLLALFTGALFARGRRTVTSWFRAAGITDDFRPASGALGAAGRRAEALAYRLLARVLRPLWEQVPGERWLFGLDDTPTAGYEVRGVDDDRLSTGLAGLIGVGVTFALAGGLFLVVRRTGRRRQASPDDGSPG